MATQVLHTDWPRTTSRDVGHRFARVLHYLTGNYLLLPLGAAIALTWANISPFSYFTMAHALAATGA